VGVATKVARRKSARERLLAASDELFYRNGVHSTGIDAVIAKADVAKGSLYYIFGGKDELVAAYLRGRLQIWRQSVEAAQAGADDPDGKILAVFDALTDYVSRPGYRGCPFHNAAAEVPAGEAQQQATKEYRDWVRRSFRQLAADTGVADSDALADALVVLYDGALATAGTVQPRRSAPMTAKRIARLTLAAARAASPS
jgi:AcrR family transcriptional regulator